MTATMREILAKAVGDWLHAPWTDESDAALKVVLIETNTVTADDPIQEITTSDSGSMGVIVIQESGFAVEIDQKGNTTRGLF